MEDELKSCPKCGGEPEVIGHFIKGVANRFHYFVRCKECRHRKNNEYKKKEGAIENWNRVEPEKTPMELAIRDLKATKRVFFKDIEANPKDEYTIGSYNGIEYALSVLEKRPPEYKFATLKD